MIIGAELRKERVNLPIRDKDSDESLIGALTFFLLYPKLDVVLKKPVTGEMQMI